MDITQLLSFLFPLFILIVALIYRSITSNLDHDDTYY
jgi:hypothetical protein